MIAVNNEHKDSECYGFWYQLLLSLFGITFLFTGIIMADLWPQIFGDIMNKVILNFKLLTLIIFNILYCLLIKFTFMRNMVFFYNNG